MNAAATGLGSALAGIIDDLGEMLGQKIGIALYGGVYNGPTRQKMAEHFTQNFAIGGIAGWKQTEFIDFGKLFRNNIANAFRPGMAAQLLPAQINESFLKMLPGFLKGGVNGLVGANAAARAGNPGGETAREKVQTDRLSSIGLYVGAGGPQAEAHAKATAKHTKTTAEGVKRLVENTAGLSGLAPGKFGGRNR
jgi:hypothetical protein